MKIAFILLLSVALSASASEVDRLLNEYKQIKTVSCKIRRTVNGGAGTVRFISRVYWANDDRLHVDNLTPVPRRIISDGKTFFSFAKGDPKGFSRPVAQLSEKMLLSLRKIPGTAMDHLLRLKGAEEISLDGQDGIRKVAYHAANQYVVMEIDSQGRLVRINFYETEKRDVLTAGYEYSDFAEIAPNIWVPMQHHAQWNSPDGSSYSETVHLDEFFANQPVAVSLFDSSMFFDKDIDFVDSFSEIYQK